MSLTESNYTAAASVLGCEVAAVKAVCAVEASGNGFLPTGEPKILFEAHIFSRLTNHAFDHSHPDISSLRWDRTLYRDAKGEHERLQRATALNRDAALQSASWGLFQIMGFNWKRCGYASLQEFINDMYKDEYSHLRAFCYFVQSMGLADELQRKDWAGFARGYNGPAYASNGYDAKLERAYTRAKG